MKLSIFKSVMEAYLDLLAHPKIFLLAAVIVLPVTLLLPETLLRWDVPPTWIWKAICLLPFVVFALVWLRLCLQVMQGQRRQQRAPSEGLVTYLGAGTVLLMLLWLPFISYPLIVVLFLELGRTGVLLSPGGWLNEYVAALLLFPPWCYLLARASVALPPAAQRKSFDLRTAWNTTAGNGWRLIGACMLATLPMLFLAATLSSIVSDQSLYFQTTMDRMATRLVSGPLQLAAAALFMNVLAGAHRQMPGGPMDDNQILMRFE
jgi:hypothetical protein